MDISFEQVFRYRFRHNWALRNILVNYFVYWRGGGNKPGDDVQGYAQKVHEFIRTNGIFRSDQYPGIGRMLIIENIFEEETSIRKRARDGTEYYVYPGLIPDQYIPLFERVVNEEYGLDQKLIEKPTPYTVAQFMWNIYHNQDRDGKKGYGSAHMLEIVERLFAKHFPQGLQVSKESSSKGEYLLVKTDDYCWPLFFISGSRILNNRADQAEVFFVHQAYKVTDPGIEFPTICGTYFGDHIKEIAQESSIQLLQISSLFKFFRWVERQKSEGITSDKIAPHLDAIPHQHEVPIPVGRAIEDMEKLIRQPRH